MGGLVDGRQAPMWGTEESSCVCGDALRKLEQSARFENCAVFDGGDDIRFSPGMDAREKGSDAIVLVDHISPISSPPHR